jgi:hypothetical protein
MTLTSGYVQNELVTAFTYEGADACLNHYYFRGKCYSGVVKFDYIVSESHLA